jgi:hypothetical protein
MLVGTMKTEPKEALVRVVASRRNGRWSATGCNKRRSAATTGHKTLDEAINRIIEMLSEA